MLYYCNSTAYLSWPYGLQFCVFVILTISILCSLFNLIIILLPFAGVLCFYNSLCFYVLCQITISGLFSADSHCMPMGNGRFMLSDRCPKAEGLCHFPCYAKLQFPGPKRPIPTVALWRNCCFGFARLNGLLRSLAGARGTIWLLPKTDYHLFSKEPLIKWMAQPFILCELAFRPILHSLLSVNTTVISYMKTKRPLKTPQRGFYMVSLFSMESM